MKYQMAGLIVLLCQVSFAQLSPKPEQIYVLHGKLDSTWGGGPAAYSETSHHKYWIVEGGIGEFKNTFVGIGFGNRTLVGKEPENAILIMTLMDYNDIQNIQSFDIIGSDASIGLLEYTDELWDKLIHMPQDELLTYCTPVNPISYDTAVNTSIDYVKTRYPTAKSVNLDGDNTPENSRYTLTWLLGIRAEFDPNSNSGPYEHIVEVNDRGIIVGYGSH